MNVLVIAPHPDDETIGCGGTVRLHVARGDRVAAVFLTSGELGLKHLPCEEAWRVREGEARAAADVLGLHSLRFLRGRDWFLEEEIEGTAMKLRATLEQDPPRLIYPPHGDESHPDHRASPAIVQAALSAARDLRPTLLGYEVWTPLSRYDHVEDISEVMPTKLEAVRCYRSQLAGFRYDRGVRGLNEYRGVMAARCEYAEVFRSLAQE